MRVARHANFPMIKSLAVRTKQLTSVRTDDRCTDMKSVRFEMRVEPEDLSRWKLQALMDGKLLTEWIRDRCNEGCEDHREESVRPEGVVDSGERGIGTSERSSVSGKTCVHGTKKGWKCWQCGGIAVIGGA